jgi:hypothetical protein
LKVIISHCSCRFCSNYFFSALSIHKTISRILLLIKYRIITL